MDRRSGRGGRTVKPRALMIALLAAAGGAAGGILFERYVGTGQLIDWSGMRHVVIALMPRDLADRAEVPKPAVVPERTMVALAFGQSNAANSGETLAPEHPGVYEFHRGRFYSARDPLLGADGNRGSVWLPLAAAAIRSGGFDSVILVPFAIGATEIRRWAPGGNLHARLLALIADARAAGLEFTHLLWHHGEGDAIAGTAGEAYAADLRAMIRSLRSQGVGAPIYVSLATRCARVRVDEAIRAAQRSVIDPAERILPGPDTDVLGFGERYDGCHFSTEGIERAAELWLQAIRGSARPDGAR
ncbi:MAG: hypothetical protein IT531_10175 [Burkholderiales bacterium]|nr:hypothetical protein [Burkholderiales bacterium]